MKTLLRSTLAIAGLVLAVSAPVAAAGPQAAPSPVRSWLYALPAGWHLDSLAPGPGGAVYLLVDHGGGGGATVLELRALRSNGRLAWRLPVGSFIAGGGPAGPLVGGDGTVYQELLLPGGATAVVAVSPSGARRWLYRAPGDETFARPEAADAAGVVYLGFNGGVQALSRVGGPLWRFATPPGPADSYSPLVRVPPRGPVLVLWTSLGRSGIDALAASGRVVRRLKPPASLARNYGLASTLVGPDGTMYMNTTGGIEALGWDGKVRWRSTVSGSPAAIAADGTLYVEFLSADGGSETVTALGPGGAVLFARRVAARPPGLLPPWPSLATAPHGLLYALAGSSGQRLVAFDRTGGTAWSIALPAGAQAAGPVVGPDGTAYLLVLSRGRSAVYAYTAS